MPASLSVLRPGERGNAKDMRWESLAGKASNEQKITRPRDAEIFIVITSKTSEKEIKIFESIFLRLFC